MSDFLSNLVERSLSTTATVRPQLPSIFEPPSINGGAFFHSSETPELPTVEQQNQDPANRVSRLQSVLRITTPASVTQFVATLSKAGLISPESAELPSASQQIRTGADLPEKSMAASSSRGATADEANKHEKNAAALRSPLPAEHTASPSTANKPAPHDSTKNRRRELGTKKIIEMIAPERDPHRELIQVRDVHAVSRQAPSPRLIAPARQQKNAPVPPAINVTIGRVEVRAVPPVRESPRPKAPPVLSLEDYLRQRSSGGRR
jgi:hypothetical protein